MDEITPEIRSHLVVLANRVRELEELLGTNDVLSDPKQLRELSRERRRLQPLVEQYEKLLVLEQQIDEAKEVLASGDNDLRELAEIELAEAEAELPSVWKELKPMLVPPDPDDDREAILEVRAGTGGEEASLFAGELLRMYQRWIEKKRWKWELLSMSEAEQGGVKEAVVAISSEGAYGTLKYESGVHRVQRVPTTEAQGRIHTSAASVAVLPQAEEVDVVIDEKELRIDTYRASGAGGQHVNMTDSAVRITHLPSNIVVTCSDERSQIKNRARAMTILRTRLFDRAVQNKQQKEAAARKEMVSTGDRSAKIRTYNYPQSRITDHRINLTLYNLPEFLGGEIDDMLKALAIADRSERLARMVQHPS
ncbi:MAG: peptide chain release factor 1 [bacterium]|nr:peptide chain release factor 1 [bacterium]